MPPFAESLQSLAAWLVGTVLPRTGRRPFVSGFAVMALLAFGTVQPTTPATHGQARGGRAAAPRLSTGSRFDMYGHAADIERPGTTDIVSAPAGDTTVPETPVLPLTAIFRWTAAVIDPPAFDGAELVTPFAPVFVSRVIAPVPGRAPPLS